MSNRTGSGANDLKAFCSTALELNDLLRFRKFSKQRLYKNDKHEGSILQGFECFDFDPPLRMYLFPRVFSCSLS